MQSHWKQMKRVFVFFVCLTVAMTMGFTFGTSDVNAAAKKAKKITLEASSDTVMVGDTIQISVASVTPAKASKKVKWKITAGKKFAKITSKKATSVTLKGLKVGKVTVKATAKKGKAKKSIQFQVVPREVKLKSFGITGYYSPGAKTINTVPIAEELSIQAWNPETNQFEAATTDDINGNYTALFDTGYDDVADLVKIVKFADGPKYWDAEAAWVEGVGAETVPNVISDEEGQEMFGAEYRIPMGERMLTEFGLGAYSGTTDWANLKDGGYWENNYADFYHMPSNDTRTMLTGYKTELQPSGSLCVMSSASTVLEWYGQRGDLNEMDLALLRGNDQTEKRGTSLDQTIQVFEKLGELGLTCEWDWTSYYDFDEEAMEADWVQYELEMGHPIIVISNSYGAHGQVIIGYDNMGTDDTLDDVCIMMDPYDTTDQNNDGYIIQPFERLQYSLLTWPNKKGKIVTTGCKYISVWPADPADWDNDYEPTIVDGVDKDTANKGNFSQEMKLDYGRTADDIASFYPLTPDIGPNGLAGAATGGYENSGNFDESPYFTLNDYYNMKNGDGKTGTLHILHNFKTIQQSTEWTCGTASALMNIEWFDMNENRVGDDPGAGFKETDVSLATHRQKGRAGATSNDGMKEVFEYMSDQYDQEWCVLTNEDMVDPDGEPDPEAESEETYIGDYCLQAGDSYPEDWPGLIPYLIDNGIPMMIGSDEWGGHWQVIIGYDGMGTEGT